VAAGSGVTFGSPSCEQPEWAKTSVVITTIAPIQLLIMIASRPVIIEHRVWLSHADFPGGYARLVAAEALL